MVTNSFFRSDLPGLYNIVQNSMIVYPKEAIIAILRDFFSKDSFYHYVRDEWGFAKNVEQKDLPTNAGISDDLTTRIFIGETFRFDGIFYPCILVKHNSSRYVPISINRENTTIAWELRTFEDDNGNLKFFKNPKSFVFSGAWEGSVSIDIITKSSRARDELVELTAMCFTDINFENLKNAGIICKPMTVSGPSEQDDRNDKLFRQSINMEIRTEWRREIPIKNVLEVISFAIDFGNLQSDYSPIAQNISIKQEISFLDSMMSL